jgi:ATP-dependent DNA helicase DinG
VTRRPRKKRRVEGEVAAAQTEADAAPRPRARALPAAPVASAEDVSDEAAPAEADGPDLPDFPDDWQDTPLAEGADDDTNAVPDEQLERAVTDFFAPGGPLARVISGYEDRPEQRTVALAVTRSLVYRRKLLAEAGTGTGKTLAYLVPLVLSGRRVVVSTATKNLQDQVMSVDVPLLARALGRRVEARLMKGRGNYLCLARSQRALGQKWLAGVDDQGLMPEITAWAEHTTTGDRAELEVLPDGAPFWRELSATSEQCTGRACASFERCFVTLMRRRAQSAEVVVVNHHLYFAELSLRDRVGDPNVALLPGHELVVFDEAHELEEVGGQHFGVEVAEGRFYELGRDLVRAAGAEAGVVARLRVLALELDRRTRFFFAALPAAEARVALRPVDLGDDAWAGFRALSEQLERVVAQVAPLALEDAASLARRAGQLASELRFAIGAGDDGEQPRDRLRYDPSPDFAQLDPEEEARPPADDEEGVTYVRYLEAAGRSRALVARPIEVAPILRRELSPLPAVFVSATLSVGGDFTFLRRRLGVDDADEVVVDSPFDYAAQATLYLPDDVPSPEAPEFGEQAAARAAELVAASGGGAFVLCTSHRMLGLMRRTVAATGVLTLVQGDAPKGRLLEQFKAAGNAALCATLSFWQGVDVPGRALRLVIIDRLPFASPGDPLLAARLEHLRARGHDPFRSYQLPQAALLLRQGFGRLIRRRTDHGMVALLDRRISTRGYGAMLLATLPPCRRVDDRQEALALLAANAG